MQDVKTLKRWMVYKLNPQPNGTVDKQPLSVYGGFASSDDPATWGTYEEARKYILEHESCALGFALGKEVGLVVVDIDKARGSKDAEWPEWVKEVVDELDSFTEVSCSGLGMHIWLWGEIPANRNNQKCHVELHDSKKMFVVSQAFADECDKIKAADLTNFFKRVDEGKIGPDYVAKKISAFAYGSDKFERACNGDTSDYDYDTSRAVQGVLWTLAKKFKYDEQQIRDAFEATALCALWEQKGKWTRLGDGEIARAISKVKALEKQDKAQLNVPLERQFKMEKVEGKDDDFVLQPLHQEFDGWFPRGAVSIIAGASGAGKSSIMTVLLEDQKQGREYLGHKGQKLDYLIVFFDRKKRSAMRTLKRLGLYGLDIKMEFSSVAWGMEAIQTILDAVERYKAPPVLFIEGGDIVVQKPNDISYVTPVLTRLQEIAEHYHIAIVMSLGSPKKYEDKKVLLSRDNIFGSQVWGRMTDTVAIINITGDGTEETRQMVVQHRDASPEKFDLIFLNGRLVPTQIDDDGDEYTRWMRQQTEGFTYDMALGHFESIGYGTRAQLKSAVAKLEKAKKLKIEGSRYRWKTNNPHQFKAPEMPVQG